jgi:hypothetical protein
MKGLQESTNDGIFLVIKHGGIVQESKNPREGFTPIEVVNVRSGDKTVKYIKRYKGVEALIKKIDWYDREFEDTRFMGWKLLLDADGTACTLDLPFESRVGSRFMKLAENIDYSQPVEFSAWKGTDDKTAFAVKQNGENVPQKYTRENPGDCPPPVQGFNKKWNFDAQKEFLHERMMQVVIPAVQAVNGMNGHHEQGEPEIEPTDDPVSTNQSTLILERLKSDLKEYSAQEKITSKDAVERWFGTRSWREVEKMDVQVLKEMSEKIIAEIVPF